MNKSTDYEAMITDRDTQTYTSYLKLDNFSFWSSVGRINNG